MSAKLIPQIELKEWIDSINWILADNSSKDVSKLLERLKDHCITQGVEFPFNANTPYVNTIPIEEEIPYPGDIEIEKKRATCIASIQKRINGIESCSQNESFGV